jgi:hypothetical protein
MPAEAPLSEMPAEAPLSETPAEAPLSETPAPDAAASPETVVEPQPDAAEQPEAAAAVADETQPVEQPETPAPAAEGIPVKYINRTRKELVATFEQLLRTPTNSATETLRKEADLIKAVFYRQLLEEQKNAGVDQPAAIDELELKFKKLYGEYRQRRVQYAQLAEQVKEDNLAKKLAIIEELKTLLDKQEDLTQTFPTFRALQQHWRETGPVPIAHTKDIWDTYQHLVERFYDYVKINNELRDLDLKRNLEAKMRLCEKAEELLLEPNIVNAAIKLQRYHEQWREIGPVASELRKQVWERFKNATTSINKKQQAHFDRQKEEQKKNLAAKIALCEKAEEIARAEINGSTWMALSKKVEKLQKIWKTIGATKQRENTKVYERFRKACDAFFIAKRDFYEGVRIEMQENLQLKLDLLKQAEELKESDDWKQASDKFFNLQKQWNEIGPITRKQTEELWKRFRTACDYFFDRRKKHFSTIDAQYGNNLRLKQNIIKEIEAFVPGKKMEDNLNVLQSFQRRWNETGYVPAKSKESIQAAYRAAIDKQFAALHLSTSEKKIIRFKNRIEDIQHSSTTKANYVIRSEREKLVQKLRQLETDVALWENNIGFFSKSKKTAILIADFDKKIADAREEIATIEAQIKLIDKQYE